MNVVTNTSEAKQAILRGRTRFLGLDFLTDANVLVPREETELLANLAIKTIESDPAVSAQKNIKAIDMCCGAGNIACAIAASLLSLSVWASDLTPACFALTRRNVELHALDHRVFPFQGDLFAPLADLGLQGTMDLIVCNPPYISQGKLAAEGTELLTAEPREAFDGGPYGLSIHQRVCKEAVNWLKPGGWLLFEFGLGQHKQLQAVFKRVKGYSEVEFAVNDRGEPRAARARRI